MTLDALKPINETKKIQLNFAVDVLALSIAYPIIIKLCLNSGLSFAVALAHYMIQKSNYVHEIQVRVMKYLVKTGLSYRD